MLELLAEQAGVKSTRLKVQSNVTAQHSTSDKLVVAHFDHGIRPDSAADARFVQGLADFYGLDCEIGIGKLGPNASEAEARSARWAWLRQVAKAHNAKHIYTAHHADDVLETAIINLLRGTGRQGLASLQDTDEIKRPLLGWNKPKIYQYAAVNKLEWVEDETNATDDNLRNRVRRYIIPKLSPSQTQRLRKTIAEAKVRNLEIDQMLSELADQISTAQAGYAIDRHSFGHLPDNIQRELVRFWMKRLASQHGELKQLHIQKAVEFINTQSRGKLMELPGGLRLVIESQEQARIFGNGGKPNPIVA